MRQRRLLNGDPTALTAISSWQARRRRILRPRFSVQLMQGSGLFAPGVPARGNISTTIMPGATATARAARATAQRARPRRRGGLRLAVALLVAAAAAVAVAVAARPTPVRVGAVQVQRGGFRDVGVAAGSEDSARAYGTGAGAAGSAAGGTAVGKGGEWRGHWLFESPAHLRIDGTDGAVYQRGSLSHRGSAEGAHAWAQSAGVVVGGGAGDMHAVGALRRLQQDAGAAGATVVVTAGELQEAVARGDAHIEVRRHLDLSALEPRAGTAAPGFEKLALGALPPSIKSLRVRRHSTRTTACMPHVP